MKKIKRLGLMFGVLLCLAFIAAIFEKTTIYATDKKNGVYDVGDCSVRFEVVNEWDEGCTVNITITNTGDSIIEDWCISFPFDYKIESIWNAQVIDEENNKYVIKNLGWNQDILMGESISFGFNIEGKVEILPQYFTLQGTEKEVPCENYLLSLEIVEDWGSGYKARIKLQNNTQSKIEDWKLMFNFENEITNLWNAQIIKCENTEYIIKGYSYNQNIDKNSCITFDFLVESGESEKNLSDIKLYEFTDYYDDDTENIVSSESTEEDETVEEDEMVETDIEITVDIKNAEYNKLIDMLYICDKLPDISGTISSKENVKELVYYVYDSNGNIVDSNLILSRDTYGYEVVEGWKLKRNIGLSYGINTIRFLATSINDRTYCEEINVYNALDDCLDYITITGNDDELEMIEAIKSFDYDFDGIYDYYEKYLLNTDPFKMDSDENGIMDSDEDFDGDGLSNRLEMENGFNPYESDSDFDGVIDSEELLHYHTDGCVYDSDGDGASDGWELKNGYDPLGYDCEFDCIEEIKLGGNIQCSRVSLCNADGRAVDTFVANTYEDSFLNNEIPGFIDSAIEYQTDGEFDSAYVEYELNSNLFEADNCFPVLYYFNEQQQRLEVVENQKLEGNILSANLQHFSKYIILNEAEYSKVVKQHVNFEMKYEKVKGIDYLFIINTKDDGGVERRIEFIIDYMGRLGKNDRVALMECGDNANLLVPFTRDRNKILGALNGIENSDDCVCDVEDAISIFYENGYDEVENEKCIMSISVFDNKKIKEYGYDKFKEKNISVFNVNMGFDMSNGNNVLPVLKYSVYPAHIKSNDEKMRGWESEFFDCRWPYYFRNTIEYVYEYSNNSYYAWLTVVNYYNIEEFIKDSDEDGLPDYVEIAVNEGDIRDAFGKKMSYMNPLKSDSDGDGLSDSEEVSYWGGMDAGYIYVRSYANKTDSDCDGVWDKEDPWPLIRHDFSNLKGRLIIRDKQSYLANLVDNVPKWSAYKINEKDKYYKKINIELPKYYNTIAIHHTARNQYENIYLLEENEITGENHFNGMPYHFVIAGNGMIYEGKPLNVMGEHIAGANSYKIGVALMGNFHSSSNGIKYILKDALPSYPTEKQKKSLIDLSYVLITQYGIDEFGGHFQFAKNNTACPGNRLYAYISSFPNRDCYPWYWILK